MTREEAKEILTHNWTRVDNPNYSESELDEAFFMAIEALSAEYEDYEHATLVDIKEPLKVAVVRCKDCRYCEYCEEVLWCNRTEEPMKEDDFCSYGERRK